MLKPSLYNHFIPQDNGSRILFNARTLATCIIDEYKVNEVNDLLNAVLISEKSPLIDAMSYAEFLISHDVDEKMLIQNNLNQARKSKKLLGLTIAPTLGCNFNCPYCFESESSRANFSKMSLEVQQQILTYAQQFIQDHDSKFLTITWFGGEPLIAIEVIKRLSKEFLIMCENMGIQYNASIITNGFKLTPENVETLLEAKVNNVQITIDGPEHIHDERRILKNGKGSYQKIVSNMVYAIEKGLKIDVRVNVDASNFEQVTVLLDDFENRHLKNKVSISLGHVMNSYNNLSEKIEGLEGKTYANINLKIKKMTGQSNSAQSWLPRVVSHQCGADREASFMIGPKGELYQCWDDFGDPTKVVGNIASKLSHHQDYIDEYTLFDPTLHPKCSSCNVMPLCMGGCSKQRLLHHGEPQCGVYKYNLNDRIINYVEKKTLSQTA